MSLSITTPKNYQFINLHPQIEDVTATLLRGLLRSPKSIPPQFYYDQRGSELFEAICHTPEYYPTRTETAIMGENAISIAAAVGTGAHIIEPGSGNSAKIRQLLTILQPKTYIALDISSDFIQLAGQQLAQEFPWLEVRAVCSDFTHNLQFPDSLFANSDDQDNSRKVAYFPGSTIGNFTPEEAKTFLQSIANRVGNGGGLLIGVDLIKNQQRLHDAYNDAAGITAEFNLNVLHRINRELQAGFLVKHFQHIAFYNETEHRIEMHLECQQTHTVTIGSETITLQAGERICTEYSYKYSIDSFQQLAQAAGFSCDTVWTDAEQLFSIHYLQVC